MPDRAVPLDLRLSSIRDQHAFPRLLIANLLSGFLAGGGWMQRASCLNGATRSISVLSVSGDKFPLRGCLILF